MFCTILCILVILFIYFAGIKPYKYWLKLGVPSYSVWQLWKHTVQGLTLSTAVADAVKRMYDDFEGHRYFGAYQFYRPVLTVRDPELIKQITVKDFDHFEDHSKVIPDNSEPLLEKNLIALTGDKWRDMRATLSPSFTGSKMKIMFELMTECSNQFVDYFHKQDSKMITIEMKDIFTRYTNDVIASTAFGLGCDSLTERDNDFYKMGKEITNFSGNIWVILKFILIMIAPRFAKAIGMNIFDPKVTNFFKRVIKETIREREKQGIIRPDMIHLLMEARKERMENQNPIDATTKHKDQLSEEDIVAQAMIFFFAGFDSVSTLLCFMAYELAINTDVQQTLQAEIDDILNDYDGKITYDALSKMKYMDMVVSESLRKWPVAVMLDRLCVKPYTIPSIKEGEPTININKGDMLWLSVFGLHRDPEYYPEPDRFDPDRFSDENKSKLNHHAYIPFGSGPRNCIGNRFALMETKLVFFHILSKFNITVVEKTPIPLKLAPKQFQLAAEGGFWLGLEKRSEST